MRFKEALQFACSCQLNPACTSPQYVGCPPFEHVAGQLVVVGPQLLGRRIRQAWFRKPLVLRRVPIGESRSAKGIVVRGG